MQKLTRRTLLRSIAGAWCCSAVAPLGADEPTPSGKTILLRSGWQTENIGDIAHTPGVLRILETYLPQHRVILWSRAVERGVAAMLQRSFPNLQIVGGQIDPDTGPDNPALREAVGAADLLLHGSGPSLVAQSDVAAWIAYTGKPYGALGITTQQPGEPTAQLLSQAAFLFTRETHSLEHLKQAGVTEPKTGFAPDGTFAMDVRDDARAAGFLETNQLQAKQFICVVPRLRYTPYYKFKPHVNWSEEKIREVEETNARWAEADHAKAREAMVRWVRETGSKVLVCPEMTYQLEIMDELLLNPLPDDVREHVVCRRSYWLPDEAAAVYRRAAAVLSFECHSPILAFANGTPAFYLRQPQDTIKGQMWYDIGVPKWVFEIEQTTGEQIAERLMEVHSGPQAAEQYLAAAMQRVKRRYGEAASVFQEFLLSV